MTRLLIFMALLTIGLGAMFGPIERAMLYPFDATRLSPQEAGEPRLTEITFNTAGESLILWVAPPKGNKPVILYFHGNAGNLANRAGRFRHFLDRGYGLVAPAYRGSSGSTGTPSEADLRADSIAIWAALPSLLKDSGAAPVILYGESLGTGLVIGLLAANTPQNTALSGAILEAPYTSIEAVAAHAYPALSPLIKMMRNKWDSLALAPNISAPLLVLHGDQDRLIPIEQGRQIYAAARSNSKLFIPVKGASHTTIWRSDTLPKMWAFIDAYADR